LPHKGDGVNVDDEMLDGLVLVSFEASQESVDNSGFSITGDGLVFLKPGSVWNKTAAGNDSNDRVAAMYCSACSSKVASSRLMLLATPQMAMQLL
jgi:hypothetical protein